MKSRDRKTPPPPWAADLADRLLILANPTRLEILADLVAHPKAIARDVADRLGLTEAGVSHHKKILEAAGLVADGRNGPQPRRGMPGKTLTMTPGPAIKALESVFDLLSGSSDLPASLPFAQSEPGKECAA